MKTILFLMLTGLGWHKFEEYHTFYECEEVRLYIVINYAHLEGLCLTIKEPGYITEKDTRSSN